MELAEEVTRRTETKRFKGINIHHFILTIVYFWKMQPVNYFLIIPSALLISEIRKIHTTLRSEFLKDLFSHLWIFFPWPRFRIN